RPDKHSAIRHCCVGSALARLQFICVMHQNKLIPQLFFAFDMGVHNFVEHRYALLELSLLGQDQDDLAESDQQ
ncbi:hypothetical protein MJL22_28540, partial [Salmonella enterica subsp. enterica serovar Montevideo]|nr:hypothetical protein [Salmonella enterica subsp. enterica serovar Montevideo]